MTSQDNTRLLAEAWQAIVKYRHAVYADTGAWRPHLVDLDLWGVLQELAEDSTLIGTPDEVMTRILDMRLEPDLAVPMVDPAQDIYDAITTMLNDLGVVSPEGEKR